MFQIQLKISWQNLATGTVMPASARGRNVWSELTIWLYHFWFICIHLCMCIYVPIKILQWCKVLTIWMAYKNLPFHWMGSPSTWYLCLIFKQWSIDLYSVYFLWNFHCNTFFMNENCISYIVYNVTTYFECINFPFHLFILS